MITDSQSINVPVSRPADGVPVGAEDEPTARRLAGAEGKTATFSVSVRSRLTRFIPDCIYNGCQKLGSLLGRKVTERNSVAPALKPDLPSPEMKILQVPPDIRRQMFRQLLLAVCPTKGDANLSTGKSNPAAYTPESLEKPFGLDNKGVSRHFFKKTFHHYWNQTSDVSQLPFDESDDTLFFDSTSELGKLIEKRAEQLINQGLEVYPALSAAINECLDALLIKLDAKIDIAISTKESYSLTPLMSLSMITMVVQLLLYSLRISHVKGDIQAFLDAQKNSSDQAFGRLIIHSTGLHTFVELIRTGDESGRAVGRYPKGRKQNTAALAGELTDLPSPLRLKEDDSVIFDLASGCVFSSMGSINFSELRNIPDLSLAMKSSAWVLPAAQYNKYIATSNSLGLFKASIVDEYKAYKNESVSSERIHFPLDESEYQKVSDFLDVKITQCREDTGDCQYDIISQNCMHFAQEVFEQTPYNGYYVDYLSGIRPLERSLVELGSNPWAKKANHVSGTVMLALTLWPMIKKLATRSCQIIRTTAATVSSGLYYIGQSLYDRACRKVPPTEEAISLKKTH